MVSKVPTDQSEPVRQGEELPVETLAAYLESHIPGLDWSSFEVSQFPSGHSNLTYLLRAGDRELVLRRPPFGAKIKSAHDMSREYTILSHLIQVYPKVPRPLLYCEDDSVMGAPFYVMERIHGVILRGALPGGLDLNASTMHSISENFIDNLVEIHRVDVQAAGMGELGHPEGYVKRQVEGWTRRYLNAQTDDVPDIHRAAKWLAENLPEESGGAFIHNDYKYDNLVLDPQNLTEIIGVLDWEMATIGDPLMDLGTSLGYWVDPDDPPEMQAMALGLTTLTGNLSRVELAERYAWRTGSDISNLTFYYVYALFKIAGIIQQIYARYKAGYTRDERFAGLIYAVQVLGRMAVQAIAGNRIDHLG